MRFLLFTTSGLALLALCGCTAFGDVMEALKPVIDTAIDTAANTAANTANAALKDQLGERWTGPETAAAVTGSAALLAGLVKGALYAWNRNPRSDVGTP